MDCHRTRCSARLCGGVRLRPVVRHAPFVAGVACPRCSSCAADRPSRTAAIACGSPTCGLIRHCPDDARPHTAACNAEVHRKATRAHTTVPPLRERPSRRRDGARRARGGGAGQRHTRANVRRPGCGRAAVEPGGRTSDAQRRRRGGRPYLHREHVQKHPAGRAGIGRDSRRDSARRGPSAGAVAGRGDHQPPASADRVRFRVRGSRASRGRRRRQPRRVGDRGLPVRPRSRLGQAELNDARVRDDARGLHRLWQPCGRARRAARSP